jgi:hypothetical protein
LETGISSSSFNPRSLWENVVQVSGWASSVYIWFKRIIARTSRKKDRSGMRTSDELTCREVVELVTDYLEMLLLPEEEARFEEHVASCPGCTAYVEQIRQTIERLHMLSAEPVFPETKEELLRIFQEWKRG